MYAIRSYYEDAAINEFSEYGLEKASINRIVENSEIAKGSFYQYFSDKKDLYLHIIQLIGQEKMKYISDTLKNPQKHDIFTLIKELYVITSYSIHYTKLYECSDKDNDTASFCHPESSQ